MSGIWLVIREAATSKKFIMSIAAALTGAALKIGLDLPVEDVAAVLSPMVAYIFAQGFADRGKSAAKVEALANVTASAGAPPAQQVRVIKEA